MSWRSRNASAAGAGLRALADVRRSAGLLAMARGARRSSARGAAGPSSCGRSAARSPPRSPGSTPPGRPDRSRAPASRRTPASHAGAARARSPRRCAATSRRHRGAPSARPATRPRAPRTSRAALAGGAGAPGLAQNLSRRRRASMRLTAPKRLPDRRARARRRRAGVVEVPGLVQPALYADALLSTRHRGSPDDSRGRKMPRDGAELMP